MLTVDIYFFVIWPFTVGAADGWDAAVAPPAPSLEAGAPPAAGR